MSHLVHGRESVTPSQIRPVSNRGVPRTFGRVRSLAAARSARVFSQGDDRLPARLGKLVVVSPQAPWAGLSRTFRTESGSQRFPRGDL
jgi:hypothetical protein